MLKGHREPISRRGFLGRMLAVGLLVAMGDHLLDALSGSRRRSPRGEAFAGSVPVHPEQKVCAPTSCLSEADRRVLEALTAVVIPSDELGPGAREAGVNLKIERMLGASPVLLNRYADGVRAFDTLARTRNGLGYAELSYDQQVELFTLAAESKERLWPKSDPQSLAGKVRGKLHHWYYRRYVGVTDPMMIIVDQMARDVSESYYATQLAWDSLGYSGPPFPFGYVGRPSPCVG